MRWWRLKALVNLLNLSTPLGVLLAVAGRARLRRGPRGLVLGHDYRLPLPAASAFTLGNVVVTKHPEGWLLDRPRLLAHEERHTWQYAACLGLPMLPMYVAGSVWSTLRTGTWAAGNPFERLAGLADGGYPEVGPRPLPRPRDLAATLAAMPRRARRRRPRSAPAAP